MKNNIECIKKTFYNWEDIKKVLHCMSLFDNKYTMELIDIEDDTIYIKYAKQDNILMALKNNQFTKVEVYSIAKGCANVLLDQHLKGCIHRDVKPENFVLDEYNKVKGIDFTTCSFKPELKDIYCSQGTLGFMAPERFNLDFYDQKSDIWSLGITLYEILYGKELPCIDVDHVILNRYQSIVERELSNIKELHTKEILPKCFDMNPMERPTCEEIVNALKKDIKILKLKN
jgi:serine/threonine protein kinase